VKEKGPRLRWAKGEDHRYSIHSATGSHSLSGWSAFTQTSNLPRDKPGAPVLRETLKAISAFHVSEIGGSCASTAFRGFRWLRRAGRSPPLAGSPRDFMTASSSSLSATFFAPSS
jgi:hypothetical protein